MNSKWSKWELVDTKTFDGDVVIIDPCYLVNGGERKWDWDEIKEWIHGVGGLESRTYYGDWGCTLYETDGSIGSIRKDSRRIGHFCADAGLVCVVHLDDVLKMSPGFADWLKEHDWCGSVVSGFSGSVNLYKRTRKCEYKDSIGVAHKYDMTELRVQGSGCSRGKFVSFESKQTEA